MRLYTILIERGWLDRVKLVAVVHDEIVLETKEELAEEAGQLLAECMKFGWDKYMKLVDVGPMEYTVSHSWEH